MTAIATEEPGADTIEAVRAFNRFYTNRIGVLDRAYLDTPYTLTEARVIYELANGGATAASQLTTELSLDPAYVSRMLKRFAGAGMVDIRQDPADGRGRLLSLTESGRAVAADLATRSRASIATLIEPLDEVARHRLTAALSDVTALLAGQEPSSPIRIRPHRVGDMGRVIASQAQSYAESYGWNEEYEALVAEICAKFLRDFDPAREHCWIAEQNGTLVGSIFLVKASETTARLRLLHVAEAARGHGLGTRLVTACIRFAQDAGYRRLELWTNDILAAARRIYQAAGFTLEKEETHHSFGQDLVGQTWALDLAGWQEPLTPPAARVPASGTPEARPV
ncbi:helix-turn-helix domain-containing GNAT family N-acetyltransferase [Shinella yambaruensis]|uniref:MarR family transcriptional regulator n=1 Tax=Shinella yambaruensis TaxID=415996 RepID=A0ABQ5ZLH9_9HYPH|nr:helix-turn-helix domain-containing GNAT family N-acetyltransferase [Shinella yambaruensis]MCJ8025222.1 helix-turn-helix domain-containing GNAT family N-acetyltransferase [Shinella yambaruensis]MCU7981144.1 helix-turn-helix domain-containing GNAT family N-acetyltransferase [Shinella yambaruensis]GLR53714.1 MarR family transcriptional regulator [Shinella yambaruensis]